MEKRIEELEAQVKKQSEDIEALKFVIASRPIPLPAYSRYFTDSEVELRKNIMFDSSHDK